MFEISVHSGEAIYLQLKEQVVRLALLGALVPGEQLPSVRVLARELGINPNTVAKAYTELEAEGVLCTAPGKGCFLSEQAGRSEAIRRSALEEFRKSAGKARQAGFAERELQGELAAVYGGGVRV